MARVTLSEYAAKRLLVGNAYQGVSVTSLEQLADIALPTIQSYVVKVDTGIKKRNQRGLVAVDLSRKEVVRKAKEFLTAGYTRILIEPYVVHKPSAERYLSFSLNRSGVTVLFSEKGGIDVEADQDAVTRFFISRSDFLSAVYQNKTDCPDALFTRVLSLMRELHVSFLEINPLVIHSDSEWSVLDLAVSLDSAAKRQWPNWIPAEINSTTNNHPAEQQVQSLANSSSASFSLQVLRSNASIFPLLSGGGASLVLFDCLVQCGLADEIAHYSEYSGAPSEAETAVFAGVVLDLLLASSATKKVLLVGGGVANFTSVEATMRGLVAACRERRVALQQQDILIRVRRGGPGQKAGLAAIEKFCRTHNISLIVSDASDAFTTVAADVVRFLNYSNYGS